MTTVYCDNCGTSLLDETAKFCRACGKPTPLSEAATKRFDEQPRLQSPTKPVAPSFTTPAYMAPLELAPAQPTNDLGQKTKRNLIILAGLLAVVIVFALAGVLAYWNSEPGQSEDIPAPQAQIPSTPPIPPLPPLPPTPGIDGPSTIDKSLIYPGARQTMSMKNILQLQSDDAARTIADWYKAKLKVTENFSIAGQTFLHAGDFDVMIMGSDRGSQILITRKEK